MSKVAYFLYGFAAAALASFLVACAGLSESEIEFGRRVLEDQFKQGQITAEQLALYIQTLESLGSEIDWVELGLSVVSSVVFVLTGIRIQRGPAKKIQSPQDAEVLRQLISQFKKSHEGKES